MSPTPSALALHLIHAMSVSLRQASSRVEWSVLDIPFSQCMTDSLMSIDCRDQAMRELFAIANLMSLAKIETMSLLSNTLHASLLKLNEIWSELLPIALALNVLRSKPGGWRHLDATWEHLTSIPLTETLPRYPINDLMDPTEDFSCGWRYLLGARHYTDPEMDEDFEMDYYYVDMPSCMYTNNLLFAAKRLPEFVLAGQRVIEGQEDEAHPDKVVVSIKSIRDKQSSGENLLMSVELRWNNLKEMCPERNLDPVKIRIHGQHMECVTAIEGVYGEKIAEVHAAEMLGHDLGL